MRKFIYKYLLPIAAAGLLFCGCTEIDESIPEVTETSVTEPSPYPVNIGSLIFNSSPETAASLSPAVTEIIFELGFSGKLTGVSSYCTYPDGAAALDKLGSAANPDTEAIIANRPQLLISHSPIAKKDITAIENAGTRVLIIPAPDSVDGLYDLYRSIFRVFSGDIDGGDDIVKEKFTRLEKAISENRSMLGSYVYILSPELAAASDSSFAGNFFSHFGKNAAADNADNTITAGELLDFDPKYLILPPEMTAADLPEELSSLSAVTENRVIILDEDIAALLERPTSRIYLAAEWLSEQINKPETSDEVTGE